MRLRAVVLICVLALGFVAGRVSAASDGSQLTGAGFAPVAAPGPSYSVSGPITPVLPPALEESVGGTLELPAAASSDEGWATWFDDGPGLYGAVPSWHWGDRPYSVTVWHGRRHVTVTIRDFCACGNRAGRPTLIDLSPAAFTRLAPLAAGVIEVRVVGGGRAIDTPLPATDTR